MTNATVKEALFFSSYTTAPGQKITITTSAFLARSDEKNERSNMRAEDARYIEAAPSMNWSTLRPGISNPGCFSSLRKEEGNVGQNATSTEKKGAQIVDSC